MRAIQPPRRCKCDECQDTYSILHELDMFAPADKASGERGAITVMH